MDRAVRAGYPERWIARSGDAVASAAGGGGDAHASEPDLAEALQLRDVLLLGRDALVAVEDEQPPLLPGVLTPPPRTDATAEQVCPTVDVDAHVDGVLRLPGSL